MNGWLTSVKILVLVFDKQYRYITYTDYCVCIWTSVLILTIVSVFAIVRLKMLTIVSEFGNVHLILTIVSVFEIACIRQTIVSVFDDFCVYIGNCVPYTDYCVCIWNCVQNFMNLENGYNIFYCWKNCIQVYFCTGCVTVSQLLKSHWTSYLMIQNHKSHFNIFFDQVWSLRQFYLLNCRVITYES